MKKLLVGVLILILLSACIKPPAGQPAQPPAQPPAGEGEIQELPEDKPEEPLTGQPIDLGSII